MHPTIATLAEAARTLLTGKADALHLDAAGIASLRALGPVTPDPVPAVALLRAELPATTAITDPVARAVQDASPHLRWRRSYSEADGFPKAFLETYGWFDLAGPDGPYAADGLRIMIGYWGPGLRYPDHTHAQEEHYLVLAGTAWFRLRDGPFRRLGPGEVFHTPPGAIHAAEMRDEALLALAIWRAEDLTVRVHLTDSDRQVEVG